MSNTQGAAVQLDCPRMLDALPPEIILQSSFNAKDAPVTFRKVWILEVFWPDLVELRSRGLRYKVKSSYQVFTAVSATPQSLQRACSALDRGRGEISGHPGIRQR